MRKLTTLLGAACVSATLYSTEAEARPNSVCGDFDKIKEVLIDNFGELPVTAGITHANTMVVQFANQTKGSWSLLQVFPTQSPKRACIIASGKGFQDARPKEMAPPPGLGS